MSMTTRVQSGLRAGAESKGIAAPGVPCWVLNRTSRGTFFGTVLQAYLIRDGAIPLDNAFAFGSKSRIVPVRIRMLRRFDSKNKEALDNRSGYLGR